MSATSVAGFFERSSMSFALWNTRVTNKRLKEARLCPQKKLRHAKHKEIATVH